jgi:hypothetical protein
MSLASQKGRAQIVIMSAIAAAAWTTVPRSANAATHYGALPSSVSGCSSNFHIGTYTSNRIKAYNNFTGETEDYGWFEWRYSNTGECRGHQWVRLHIERPLDIWGGGLFYTRYWKTNNVNVNYYYPIQPSLVNVTIRGPAWWTTASRLNPGTFNGRLLYSPNVQSCAVFDEQALVGNWDLFGPATLQGRQCA